MEASGQLCTPIVLPLGKKSLAHCIGESVGPRAGLDVVVKRINFIVVAAEN